MEEGERGARRTTSVGRPRRPALLAWLRLARVFQKVDRASAEGLRGWDLSVAQFDVLARLGANEGLTQQELADSLLVTKGNISQLLNRMEGRGLIARRPEGRALRLFLTVEGARLFREVVPAQEELIVACFSALSREEQGRLLALLREVDRALA
jgi:DNA-binding MarR family transcriptional regulator